ncbi:uncharacterized protein LOC128870305 [Anastrepha ludens]|uniref:uncharacterized protein LOC128870305 n=1 Tax=Anastrepha ludens TaxID=28586 RepID=UPI0023B156CE|nr:uncharacterized protein LOC128870305 [Anastrepha ludens]
MVHLQSCDNVLSPRSVTEYALLGCLLLTHSMSCIQIKDAVNYPLVMSDVRMHFVIRDSLMDTKIHAAINWQYFNNDEVAVDNVNNEVQSKTIIYSFEMILRESVMLLENKNLTITMNIKPVVRKIAMIAQAISSSSAESQKVSQYATHLFQADGVKYLNREILLKQNMNMLHDFKATQDTAASTMTASIFQNNFDSCQSCQMREKAKRKSLESIKNQILMRLQLSRLPNITKPIAVPHIIIDKFYKNFNGVLVGNRRSATLRDVGWDKYSNTHLSAPRRIEKDVPFLPHHTEHAANFLTHPRQFPYGQQQYYQHLNNQPKYKTFHRPQNQQLHNSRVAIVKDNRDTLLELTDVEYHQHDDVQNDEHQQYRKQQQIFSKMQQQELTNYAKGHLLNTEENGRFYGASNDDTYTTHYEHVKDYDDESYSHVNSIYIFPTTSK